MDFILAAFADESSSALSGQLDALQRNGIALLEVRNVDGKNVKDLTGQEAVLLRRHLTDAGLGVSSVGSPIGKIPVDGDFAAHLEELKHILELANILKAPNLRLFSFYMPADRPAEDFASLVIDRMAAMAETARQFGVTACHENEKGIFGDTAERCLRLHQAVPQLRAVFDPANFVQCGQDPLDAWTLLKQYVQYLHIKDAAADGRIVAPGDGAGHILQIIADYATRGGRLLTLEPHLFEFAGLQALERAGEKSNVGGLAFATAEEAFDHAAKRLYTILEEIK